MKKYRIREKSIAYYVQKAWKPVTLLAVIGLIIGGLTAATAAFAQEEPGQDPAGETITAQELKQEEYIDELPKPATWDVPLEDNLQIFIAGLCDEKRIEPELVLAIIERESKWDPQAMGDSGESYGLMQIWKSWHEGRMERLGVTDLLDPYGNVTVGIDILAEKLEKYDTLGEALTVYNAGDSGAKKLYFSKGIYANEYALEVMARAEELKELKQNGNGM